MRNFNGLLSNIGLRFTAYSLINETINESILAKNLKWCLMGCFTSSLELKRHFNSFVYSLNPFYKNAKVISISHRFNFLKVKLYGTWKSKHKNTFREKEIMLTKLFNVVEYEDLKHKWHFKSWNRTNKIQENNVMIHMIMA